MNYRDRMRLQYSPLPSPLRIDQSLRLRISAVRTFMISVRDRSKEELPVNLWIHRYADNKPSIVHDCCRPFCDISRDVTKCDRDGCKGNYSRELLSYQLREHRRRSLSAMRGGDGDAREEHHDIQYGRVGPRSGPSCYNNVTPGLARAQPG